MRARFLMMGVFFGLPSVAMAQQGSGNIKVQAGNANGEIIMDGFPMGVDAPGTLEGVPVGAHELEVEYGCMMATGTVQVVAEDTVTAKLNVENRGGQGTLRMRGLPRGAEVLVDGVPTGGLEDGVQVKCGGRSVVIEADGFETWEQVVVITTGKWTRMQPELTQGELVVVDNTPSRSQYDERDDYRDDRRDDYDSVDDEMADLDALDGPDELPPRDEFDELDAMDELDERRADDRGRDELDELDSLDGLDDYEDGRGVSERSEFDDLDELDELDEGGRTPREREARERTERDSKPLPVRGIVTGAGGVIAVTGVALTAQATGEYKNAKEVQTGLTLANQTAAANVQMAQDVIPAKQKRSAMMGLTAAGVGVAAIGYFAIEPAWQDGSVAFVPSGDGGGMVVLSGSF